MSTKRYDAEMPSETFDLADERALMASNIPSMLAATPAMRFDSEEDASVFFARELDFIKSKAYDKRYPEFTALQMFPITHEVPESAESFTYYGYERMGMAKIISNYATDFPVWMSGVRCAQATSAESVTVTAIMCRKCGLHGLPESPLTVAAPTPHATILTI